MSDSKLQQQLASSFADPASFLRRTEFTDTDPQMLYALWQMEFGSDPERSLDEVERAVVVYDRFRSRLASRR